MVIAHRRLGERGTLIVQENGSLLIRNEILRRNDGFLSGNEHFSIGCLSYTSQVGAHEEEIVSEVKQRRQSDAGPTRGRGNGDEGRHQGTGERDGDARDRQRPEPVAASAQEGVQACVE